MSEIIDISLIATKIAALNDEKARMAVSGVSLAYNADQINRFRSMAIEYSEILSIIAFRTKHIGYSSIGDIDIARQCNEGISFCQQRISKHQVIAITDLGMLLFDAVNSLSKKD